MLLVRQLHVSGIRHGVRLLWRRTRAQVAVISVMRAGEKIIGHLPRTPTGTKGTVGHQVRKPFPLTLDCHLETLGSYILALE